MFISSKSPSEVVVLITGARSGIGRACAAYLVEKGYHVFGTSRRAVSESLGYTMLQVDVNDDASVQSAIAHILEQTGHIDVVMNNAGMGYGGAIEDTSIEEAQATFDTNFFGVLRLCHAVLPLMREQGGGLIINVSSIGGLMGMPYQGLYSASKFAVEGLTETLRMEVRPWNIDVVLLEPGDIATEFTANRLLTEKAKNDSPYHAQFERTLKKIEQDEHGGSQPELVARTVHRILRARSPRPRYIAGPVYELLAVWLRRIIPDWLFERVIMMNYKM